jgi:hypothetical protein
MKKTNCIYLLLLFIAIITICILLFNPIKKTKKIRPIITEIESTKSLTYRRCYNKNKGIDPFVLKLFKENNIKHDEKTWDIYYPCTYNNIEQQLRKLKVDTSDQLIYGVSGTDFIVSKNGLWELLFNKFKHNAKHIMPQTYILDNKNDMSRFNHQYTSDKIYILKKNLQRKEGLKITQDLYEIMNASTENYKVVQEYMINTLLINKRKVNLRLYLLITTQFGKVNALLHKQGKVIYTNKDYNHNNIFDLESNVTSINLNQDIYKINPLTYTDFLEYINKNYKNKDVTKVNNDVIQLVNNIILASQHKLGKLSHLQNNFCFQLYGLDIFFDNTLHPYILELNKGPDMRPKNERDKLIKAKVKFDVFEHANIIKSTDKNYTNEFVKIN